MRMKIILILAFIVSLMLASSCQPQSAADSNDWQLVWSDEFDGSEINPDNWTYDIGGGGWGNAEWEYYTDREKNARIEDGLLVIEAHKETFQGNDYTSARVKTQGLQTFTYGRIEARMKLPYGPGIWPAFWMLGEDITTEGWPVCGEIDIMENIGREPEIVHGTLHGPGYSAGNSIGAPFELESGAFKDDFHVFAIEWIPEQITWFVDGEPYETITPDRLPPSAEWVYDDPFFIILNLAVGGNWPGYPNESTIFPQQLLIDYVRVYQMDTYPEPDTSILQGSLLRLTDIQLEVQEKGNNYLGEALVTVTDEHGNPVQGVDVSGQWTIGGENQAKVDRKTDQDGIAGPFKSKTWKDASASIKFCATKIEKDGYVFDSGAGINRCQRIEP
ncbi:MAG: family 16 glycosylhydrolase [Anaerolineaceae bacterium]|nr:family 16 glycosylhydrolase [Anaerolineaceae bacterium]